MAKDLGLLNLVKSVAVVSPSVLASISVILLVAVPDDSAALVALQAVLAGLQESKEFTPKEPGKREDGVGSSHVNAT
ncbi:hypothetical protein E2562_007734 [Oryza meyeriana var. granulata]|uniref:Uncharacterized protein n=1 Tax=Oryza meyeriana var. granulata TaxID=110450 RepID=A0A6G1EHK7_9ORYZ|nr:hypothetical protein E2562_007734 [Oryza meyeriana var. granulata]